MFEKMKFTTDLWSLGLMLFYIAKKYKLTNYIPYADILCLVEKSPLSGKYITNAEEALKLLQHMKNIELTNCGKINGVGAHGMLIDMCCDLYVDSQRDNVLCKHLETLIKNDKIKSLKIYTPKLDEVEINNKDIEEFIKIFSQYKNDIAVKYYTDVDSAKKDIFDDIISNETVNKLYKEHDDMLTFCDIIYKNYKIVGLSIEQDANIQYYYFSKRCKKTLDKLTNLNKKNLDTIISDILSSLIILHGTEYYHGDTKAQNIMLCPDQNKPNKRSKYLYKIIDWGRLYPIYRFNPKYIYGGSTQAGTPLGFYFMIRNKTFNAVPRNIAAKMALLMFEGKLPFTKLKCPLLTEPELNKKFKPLWCKIKKEFIKCVDNSSDEELFNKYKYTLDTYNFALTLLYILLKNKLDSNPKIYSKYYNIIRKMVIYNGNMITNAKDALEEFLRIL